MRIQLAPGVPDLASLGIAAGGSARIEDFGPPQGRARTLESEFGVEAVRYPLPGTPDASGRLTGRPSGVGTGFVVMRRFTSARFAASWRARFTSPRSLSFAEREWNLLCHLRQHGVNTPEPLAVGSDPSAVFGRRSFLIVRELDDLEPLTQRLQAGLSPRDRARIARSLGATLDRLFRCGVVLPHLDAHSIRVGELRAQVSDPAPCAAQQIAALRERAAIGGRGSKLGFGRLPEIAIDDVRGGWITERVSPADRALVLSHLCRSFGAVEREISLRCVARALPRAERRDFLARSFA
jgi:hypothetical protein